MNSSLYLLPGYTWGGVLVAALISATVAGVIKLGIMAVRRRHRENR